MICLYEVCKFFSGFKVASQKYIYTRPWGFAKKLLVSLVGLIGTDSLVPKVCVRKEIQHGYEAKASSPYEPHPAVIQHFECSIASKMCTRIILDI